MEIFPVMRADKSEEFYRDMEEFMKKVHGSVENLKYSAQNYCDGDTPNAKKFAKEVIKFEQEADIVRRRIEKMLYLGVILPFGRGVKYELIESIDDIADSAELVARLLQIEKLKIPPNLKSNFKSLIAYVEDTVIKLREAVLYLDRDLEKSINAATKVELIRERVRDYEFALIEKLLANMNKDIKILLLKELITYIGQIADKAEESADRVISLAVKYQG